MANQRIDKLTPEQEVQLAIWADKWIDIALRAGPTDHRAFEAAVEKCYRAAGHAWHGRVIWVPSPYQMPPSWKDRNNKMLYLRSPLHQRIVPSLTQWFLYQNRMSSRCIGTMQGSLWKSIGSSPPGKIDWHLSWHVEKMTDAIVMSTLASTLFNPVRDALDIAEARRARGNWRHLLPRTTTEYSHSDDPQQPPRLASLSFYRDACDAKQALDNGDQGWEQAWAHHQAFETASTEALLWHPTKDCVIAYERPAIIHTERVDSRVRGNGTARRNLHAEHGPAMVFPDGWAIYAIHGVFIPFGQRHIVERPDTITVDEIEAEPNTEIRRIMIDRYGPARYVADSGATVVDELPADHPCTGLRGARLLFKNVQRDESIVYVDLLNSTPEPDGSVKRYMLRVDPRAYGGEASRDAHAAAASTWRHADGSLVYSDWWDYWPVAES